MQFVYLLWQNGTATATENLNMATAIFFQQVFHVFEKLYVAALVGGNGNPLGILFYSTFYNLGNTAVMAQVYDLSSLALEDTAHDIDGRIVSVEKRGCRNDTDFVL